MKHREEGEGMMEWFEAGQLVPVCWSSLTLGQGHDRAGESSVDADSR